MKKEHKYNKLKVDQFFACSYSDYELAMNGDRLKYSVRPSGGKGNLPKPYNINAIPTPSLNKRDPKASKFEKKLLNFAKNWFINLFLNIFNDYTN